MRVCMLVYAFYESDTRVRQYVKALADWGASIDIIALGRQGQTGCERFDGVRLHRIQTRDANQGGAARYLVEIAKFLFRSMRLLTKLNRLQPFDLIHVHNVPDFLVFAAALPKLSGSVVVLDIHDLLPELSVSKFKIRPGSFTFKLLVAIERCSIAFSHHTIVANHLWRKRLIERSAPAEKCTAICNYPDETIFKPYSKSKDGTPFTLIYPGTLNAHQGLDTAIRAVSRVRQSIPDISLHIYGEGAAKRDLEALTIELGLGDNVFFHGFLSTERIASIMARAHVGVEPKSTRSSFGNEALSTKIMEFMAVQVPVIASRTTIHEHYYSDDVILYFTPDNDAELAERILKLYRDTDFRQQIISNATLYVSRNTWQVKKHKYLQLIDSLIQQMHKGSTHFPVVRPVD